MERIDLPGAKLISEESKTCNWKEAKGMIRGTTKIMSYTFNIQSEAIIDIQTAFEWYESCKPKDRVVIQLIISLLKFFCSIRISFFTLHLNETKYSHTSSYLA